MSDAKAITADLMRQVNEHTAKHPIAVDEKRDFLNMYCNADHVAVTAAGQVYEFELKSNRPDFLRDKDKVRTRLYSGDLDCHYGNRAPLPNRFWYVAPEGVVCAADIPTWSGLLLSKDGGLVEAVKAPLMWRGTHDVKVILRLAYAMKIRGTRNGQ